jgi:hypothetical protein
MSLYLGYHGLEFVGVAVRVLSLGCSCLCIYAFENLNFIKMVLTKLIFEVQIDYRGKE